MVLTVTLNPLLERRINCKRIQFGMENRDGKVSLRSGGKGINVSRQLNKLNVDNTALFFAGGSNGKMLKEILYREKIKPVAIRTESQTREALIMVDESAKSTTTCFGENQFISEAEANEFMDKLERMIPNFEIIVLSGSSPSKVTDFIFPKAIEIANKLDKISVCDTYGSHLKGCIAAGPVIVHNNVDEINSLMTGSIESVKNPENALNYLYSNNVKQSFITDGSDSFFASNFDFHFKIDVPIVNTIDATGSGDAFTSGIVYGWHNDLEFEEMVKIAVSLGANNAATFEVCNVEAEKINTYLNSVTITPIGKKMKLVDVTPK